MALADVDGPAPYSTLLEVGLIETLQNGSLCSYLGATSVSVQTLDPDDRHIVGAAGPLRMACAAGNCEFGCSAGFDLEVAFDLHWIEVEE